MRIPVYSAKALLEALGYTVWLDWQDHFTHDVQVLTAHKGNGFTVNLSGNNLAHADELADLNIAPVACVLPADHKGNTVTPKGRKVVQCPATREGSKFEKVSCATCKLCSLQRDFIIGFPAHGGSKRKASAIASN